MGPWKSPQAAAGVEQWLVRNPVCLIGHRLKINWIHVWMQQELIDTWELKNGG